MKSNKFILLKYLFWGMLFWFLGLMYEYYFKNHDTFYEVLSDAFALNMLVSLAVFLAAGVVFETFPELALRAGAYFIISLAIGFFGLIVYKPDIIVKVANPYSYTYTFNGKEYNKSNKVFKLHANGFSVNKKHYYGDGFYFVNLSNVCLMYKDLVGFMNNPVTGKKEPMFYNKQISDKNVTRISPDPDIAFIKTGTKNVYLDKNDNDIKVFDFVYCKERL